jgi:SAM-dependent methyltransferase
MTPTTDQEAFWNGASGDRWVRGQILLDALLRPYGQATREAARIAEGDAILDVGCGCGDTSIAIADEVGPTGRVVGLDLSTPMLARARERSQGRTNITLIEGDASRAPLERGTFDLLFSRFGVMFFTDPTGAFTHLRGALRPRARVAFVCWRPLAENPWAKVPLEAAIGVLGTPEPTAPDAPGPFSFGDPARIRSILEGAGLQRVSIRPFDTSNHFGGSGSAADAAREIVELGPVGRLVIGRAEADLHAAIATIEKAVTPYAKATGGVDMAAAAWVVTAENAG